MSAITNVPVAIFIRNQSNTNKLSDLINRLCIEKRRLHEITENNIENVFSEQMDFNLLNINIEKMREEGNQFLTESINKCQNGDNFDE